MNLTSEQRCALPTVNEYKFHTAFLILILILTFIGNLLVVLAVIFFRRLRSITNYFVVSLAVSDLLVAVISLPFRIDQTVHNAKWCLSYEACITWIITDTTCSFASIWNLAIISIDRYCAIVHPFRYHSIITNKVGYCMIGFVWGFSFILALTQLVNWTDYGVQHLLIINECQNNDKVYLTSAAAVSVFLPLVIILFMYGAIFRVALNQARAMAALQVASNNRGRRSSINLVKEVKAAKTLSIVIGCFMVCWLPFFIIVYISLWNKPLLLLLSRKVRLGLSMTFAYVLPAINSTLNPIIYALFNREFRQAFLKLIKRITGKRLGAVGFGERPMNGTTASVVANEDYDNHRPTRGIRFNDEGSESSEALPTIPMQDPNSFYNEGCGDPVKGPDNTLTSPHDNKSVETTLDDDGQKDSSATDGTLNDDARTLSNGNVCGEVDIGQYSKKDMPQKLPPLERNVSKSTNEDDVDFGTGKLVKSLTLPPIESTTNDNLNHSPTEKKSEHSASSSSSLVDVAGNANKDDLKTSNMTDIVSQKL